eukprot:CAMPEP_0177777142 /NCGR_PEP_ID=MMETSP0491_2-20121128/15149_1 /TAXON_ID=63592 /ORGANISM="Tetraselmis chuii, Strain PLY429" /LENGTH=185 /DNA_ID=CAMNT_0019296101 /DNA_START=6 /DNA_END=563 /DNA_ORIENTATION=+
MSEKTDTAPTDFTAPFTVDRCASANPIVGKLSAGSPACRLIAMCNWQVNSARLATMLSTRAAAMRAARRRALLSLAQQSCVTPKSRARAVKRSIFGSLGRMVWNFLAAVGPVYRYRACQSNNNVSAVHVFPLEGVRVTVARDSGSGSGLSATPPHLKTVAAAVMGLNRLRRLCRGSKGKLLVRPL